MSIFEWDEKYSFGIQSIDNQHKEIFRLLDQLFQALKLGIAPQMILKTITELELSLYLINLDTVPFLLRTGISFSRRFHLCISKFMGIGESYLSHPEIQ